MSSESVVDLNVGGLLYTTSIGTLTKVGTFKKKILSLSLWNNVVQSFRASLFRCRIVKENFLLVSILADSIVMWFETFEDEGSLLTSWFKEDQENLSRDSKGRVFIDR